VQQQLVPDTAVQQLVVDNLDLACATIEKAAMDRVVVDIDESFAQSYEARKRHAQVCHWDYSVPLLSSNPP
jgi:CCR4-NOT transcription complex subunit 1